uniref:Zona pellucida protein AX 4 n=1 Tax=Haplochromis burtoni TaxID=8153 RepID=A0A3Q3C8B9_HAPBU
MECRERYFMIGVDLSFTGKELRFEAVDGTGVHAITEQYAAKCGYTVSALPLLGHVELRASYFSCHTDNKVCASSQISRNVLYALNKTCTLSLQWSHREVTCEMNYMEVSVRSDVTCPIVPIGHKNAVRAVRSTASSDWQVTFQRPEEQMPSMNVSQARKRGYTFDSRDGRLLFRTPYGQPDSLSTEVNHRFRIYKTGICLYVILVTFYEGYFDDGGYMMWKTPEALYPSVGGTQIRIGLNGDAMEQLIAEKRGYIVEKHKGTVQIGIPYNAEGGHRKSFVIGSLYEFYAFDLSVEQISVDRDYVDTMLQFRRTLVTPLLPCTIFTRNQTVLEEQMFTIYLGDVPEDVMLVSIQLNERDFTLPFTNTSTYKVTEVLHPNGTHGYTLKVLFHDPVVKQKFFIEDAVLQFMLDINYTLAVLPGNDSYYHLASIVALFTDVSPPAFDAVCSESGIRFKLNSQPFDYLWELTIGLDVLTSDLADQRGYIFSNDSQSLQLDVPLATHGYKYQDVTLKGFSGTFEILVRVRETSEVQTSTVKTCLFNPKEFISKCIQALLSQMVSVKAEFTDLWHPLPDYVTYQNEIFYNKNDQNMDLVSSDATERLSLSPRVIVQCTYPLSSLHQLFTMYRFVSDTVGVGKIIRTVQPTAGTVTYSPAGNCACFQNLIYFYPFLGLQRPTRKPTAALQSTPRRIKPVVFVPGVRPSARYFRVSRVHNLAGG